MNGFLHLNLNNTLDVLFVFILWQIRRHTPFTFVDFARDRKRGKICSNFHFNDPLGFFSYIHFKLLFFVSEEARRFNAITIFTHLVIVIKYIRFFYHYVATLYLTINYFLYALMYFYLGIFVRTFFLNGNSKIVFFCILIKYNSKNSEPSYIYYLLM